MRVHYSSFNYAIVVIGSNLGAYQAAAADASARSWSRKVQCSFAKCAWHWGRLRALYGCNWRGYRVRASRFVKQAACMQIGGSIVCPTLGFIWLHGDKHYDVSLCLQLLSVSLSEISITQTNVN